MYINTLFLFVLNYNESVLYFGKFMSVITPNYYSFYVKGLELDAKDIINSANLSYNSGTALAYIIRAGKKEISTFYDDLNKAIRHLEFETRKSQDYPQHYRQIDKVIINGKLITYLDISKSLNLSPFLTEVVNVLLEITDSFDDYVLNLQIAIKLIQAEIS